MAKRRISKELEDGLADLAASLRRQIEANQDQWDIGPEAIAERRRLVADDLKGFEFFDRNYFPHYGKAAPSEFHLYLYERLPQILLAETGQRDVIAAPRGEAKSTKVTLSFLLWAVIRQALRYPLIFSDTFPQAAELLEAVKAELESNPRLASDFPEAVGRTRVWRIGCIVTANGAKIESFGTEKKVRGRRHGPYRPDAAFGDDLENDTNSVKPEQRDKLQSFVLKAILNLGPPDDSMHAVIVGTVLMYDSVLSRFLRNPLWHGKVFKAILKWPARMDMWDQFEVLLLTGETPDAGMAAAMMFYRSNQALMDEGAQVCWPALRPLVKLMIRRAREGHDAFDSEQQNDPVAGDDAPFAKCIQFWVNRLDEWSMYGACDPSLGLHGNKRDPSALLVGGYQRVLGILQVIEAKIKKRTPDKIITDVIDLQREYDCLAWAFESVQFQEFLRTELLKRSVTAGVPVPAFPVKPHHDKAGRIESIQPFVANGQILLHSSQSTLVDQLRHFPKADHDDGPDALEMLWKIAVSGGQAAGVSVDGAREDQTERSSRRRAGRSARRQVFGAMHRNRSRD